MLSRIHRHNYLCYYLFFVFFIELCARGKLYSGTPGIYRSQEVFLFFYGINLGIQESIFSVCLRLNCKLSKCEINLLFLEVVW